MQLSKFAAWWKILEIEILCISPLNIFRKFPLNPENIAPNNYEKVHLLDFSSVCIVGYAAF